MNNRRNAGHAPAPRPASPPPPAGCVHGLGPVDALRIEVGPAQLPWLAAEIDIARYCLEDELAHQCKRYEQLLATAKEPGRPNAREAAQELDRRAYQLQALTMIRDQLPLSREAALVATAGPWDPPADESEGERHSEEPRLAVVGPAALMTILIRGATRHVADALAEALHGARLDVDHYCDSTDGWRGRELPHINPAFAGRLRAMATATRAFTDTYLHALALQNYSFDPDHDRPHAGEPE